MGEWRKCRLGEIGRIVGGATPSTKNPAYYDGNISWITPKDLAVHKAVWIRNGERSITEEGLKSCSAQLLPKGTILFSSRAPIGYVALAACELSTNQGFKSLIPNESLDSLFGYYLLVYNRELIENLGSGTTFKEVSGSTMRDVEVSLPPLPTQRKIAAVLGAIDDKIETNRKICANLEAQAQAIFKSWFVDFEPFGGKMPKGWKITSIYDFAEIIYGAPFKSNLFNEKAIGRPIIRIRDLKNNETKTFTTEHHDREYLAQPGDLVVGMDGEFRPYIWGNYPALLNQRVCVFKPLDNVSTAFVYCTIKPQLALVEATEAATTVIHIGKEDFDSFKICLPSERWLGKFNDVAQNAFAAMTKHRLESRALAAMRDALLPKLMSGEIDVSKVEVA